MRLRRMPGSCNISPRGVGDDMTSLSSSNGSSLQNKECGERTDPCEPVFYVLKIETVGQHGSTARIYCRGHCRAAFSLRPAQEMAARSKMMRCSGKAYSYIYDSLRSLLMCTPITRVSDRADHEYTKRGGRLGCFIPKKLQRSWLFSVSLYVDIRARVS